MGLAECSSWELIMGLFAVYTKPPFILVCSQTLFLPGQTRHGLSSPCIQKKTLCYMWCSLGLVWDLVVWEGCQIFLAACGEPGVWDMTSANTWKSC